MSTRGHSPIEGEILIRNGARHLTRLVRVSSFRSVRPSGTVAFIGDKAAEGHGDGTPVRISRRLSHLTGNLLMTIARSELVDISMTRWYLCVVRCVRGASLLSGRQDRKDWLERRLEELAQIFALSVGGFTVLDNQLILLIRFDPEIARTWSNAEVARRWGQIVPDRDKARQPLDRSDTWVAQKAKDAGWARTARQRLQSLSWFMKSLTEPLARLANRQDQTRGKFFEGRHKTVAILDEESLLAAAVYIDLSLAGANDRAGKDVQSFTSLNVRTKHLKRSSRPASPKAGKRAKTSGSRRTEQAEDSLWLCPIEDRSRLGSSREGMFEGLPLKSYLDLVAFSGRLLQKSSTPVPRDLSRIFDRLEASPEDWRLRLDALRQGRLLGRVLAASRGRLQEVAQSLGLNRLSNLDSCPMR